MALITPVAPLHARGLLPLKSDPIPTSGQQLRALSLLERLNPNGLFRGSSVAMRFDELWIEAHPRLTLTLAQADALSFEDVQTLWEGGVRYLSEENGFVLCIPQFLRHGQFTWGLE